MKPENAKLFLVSEAIRLLVLARFNFLGIHGMISSAANPASAPRFAALAFSRWPCDKYSTVLQLPNPSGVHC